VFIFPSFFEGFGLVLLEAMACGLPAIASESTAGPDILTKNCGRVLPTGDLDALVDALRWFAGNRSRLPAMSRAARARAEQCSWDKYRQSVSQAVLGYV
jgi:glycosyltransferase involved in cell wall biosynthesis